MPSSDITPKRSVRHVLHLCTHTHTHTHTHIRTQKFKYVRRTCLLTGTHLIKHTHDHTWNDIRTPCWPGLGVSSYPVVFWALLVTCACHPTCTADTMLSIICVAIAIYCNRQQHHKKDCTREISGLHSITSKWQLGTQVSNPCIHRDIHTDKFDCAKK